MIPLLLLPLLFLLAVYGKDNKKEQKNDFCFINLSDLQFLHNVVTFMKCVVTNFAAEKKKEISCLLQRQNFLNSSGI